MDLHTRRCILIDTSAADLISVPMSSYSDHMVREARGLLLEGTYKYAGGAQHKTLKKKITRQESRKLSPKTTGPTVPAENLWPKR